MGSLVIKKRNGDVDTILHDGKYKLENAILEIKNGEIVSIDNGIWTPII